MSFNILLSCLLFLVSYICVIIIWHKYCQGHSYAGKDVIFHLLICCYFRDC